VIENIRRKLQGQDVVPMKPFYAGLTGDIIEIEGNEKSYRAYGKIERVDDTTLLISELPLKSGRRSTNNSLME